MARRIGLPEVWNMPQEFRDRIGHEVGRQRAMFADGHLLLVLHEPPKPEDVARTGRFFWRQPDGTWTSDKFGSGIKAVGQHLDEYFEIVTNLEKRDDAAVTSTDYFGVNFDLAPIQRASRNMHQALQQAREFCPGDHDLINFRDRAYRIERTAELLYSDAKNSLEFLIARRAEEQAQSAQQMSISAHRLNLLVAFFFPIATLSAIFGVNLKQGMEENWPPIPFYGVLLVGTLLGGILMLFLTGKSQK